MTGIICLSTDQIVEGGDISVYIPLIVIAILIGPFIILIGVCVIVMVRYFYWTIKFASSSVSLNYVCELLASLH